MHMQAEQTMGNQTVFFTDVYQPAPQELRLSGGRLVLLRDAPGGDTLEPGTQVYVLRRLLGCRVTKRRVFFAGEMWYQNRPAGCRDLHESEARPVLAWFALRRPLKNEDVLLRFLTQSAAQRKSVAPTPLRRLLWNTFGRALMVVALTVFALACMQIGRGR